MPLANCPRCGKLFNKMAIDICKDCQKEEDELLRETQEYLRQNRSASKIEILDEVEVEPWLLDKWVTENRINIIDQEELMSKRYCVECGREIKGGGESICRTCQLKKLSSKGSSSKTPSLDKVEQSETKKTSRGMHYKKPK